MLGAPANPASQSYNHNYQHISQASQIYKSQKLRAQASIQDSPYKAIEMQNSSTHATNNHGASSGDNNTTSASTGVSAGSGASTNLQGLPQTKQKQRQMMSPTKLKKSDPELQFAGSNSGSGYKVSRPQMLNIGLTSDY